MNEGNEELLKRLTEDIENAQEDCATLDWVNKDQAIELIREHLENFEFDLEGNLYDKGYDDGEEEEKKERKKFEKGFNLLMKYWDTTSNYFTTFSPMTKTVKWLINPTPLILNQQVIYPRLIGYPNF